MMTEETTPKSFAALLKKLDLPKPVDRRLIEQALTHSSINQLARENGNLPLLPDNERLEFLGDAVLKLSVSHWLYQAQPDASEGTMSKIRAYIVSDVILAEIARQINLGRYIRMGAKETASGGKEKRSVLASSLEALIGAVFLATDYNTAASMTLRLLGTELQLALSGRAEEINYKATLQEYTQARFKCLPEYEVIQTDGPPHARSFTCVVRVQSELMGRGSGTTIKMAEQAAAEEALKRLRS